MRRNSQSMIQAFYRELTHAWGPQHWWPAETQFEVVVGAYLTQNTAWTNVRRAMDNLRASDCLSVTAVREVRIEDLERMVRPAGYFRQKAQRLKTFVRFLDVAYGGDLDRMFGQKTGVLREQLLALNGVGPETADSILLYAGNHSVFVVDAYTRRVFERHGVTDRTASYEEIRQLVERALADLSRVSCFEAARNFGTANCASGAAHPPSAMSTAKRESLVQVFNQMHALIIGVGKNHCFKSNPDCDKCPLRRFLPRAPQPERMRRRPPYGHVP